MLLQSQHPVRRLPNHWHLRHNNNNNNNNNKELPQTTVDSGCSSNKYSRHPPELANHLRGPRHHKNPHRNRSLPISCPKKQPTMPNHRQGNPSHRNSTTIPRMSMGREDRCGLAGISTNPTPIRTTTATTIASTEATRAVAETVPKKKSQKFGHRNTQTTNEMVTTAWPPRQQTDWRFRPVQNLSKKYHYRTPRPHTCVHGAFRRVTRHPPSLPTFFYRQSQKRTSPTRPTIPIAATVWAEDQTASVTTKRTTTRTTTTIIMATRTASATYTPHSCNTIVAARVLAVPRHRRTRSTDWTANNDSTHGVGKKRPALLVLFSVHLSSLHWPCTLSLFR